MRNNGEQAWDGGDLQHEVQVENVEGHGENRQLGAILISLCHLDLSTTISLGPWHLSGTPEQLLEACEKNLPAFLRSMEARVPKSRGSALPSDDFWVALSKQGMVIEVLVPDRRERR